MHIQKALAFLASKESHFKSRLFHQISRSVAFGKDKLKQSLSFIFLLLYICTTSLVPNHCAIFPFTNISILTEPKYTEQPILSSDLLYTADSVELCNNLKDLHNNIAAVALWVYHLISWHDFKHSFPEHTSCSHIFAEIAHAKTYRKMLVLL